MEIVEWYRGWMILGRPALMRWAVMCGEEPLAIYPSAEECRGYIDRRFGETMTQGCCEDCRWWDNSRTSAIPGHEDTGMCRAMVPTTDDRTGLAIWPLTEAGDWCACFARPVKEQKQTAFEKREDAEQARAYNESL